MPAAKAPAEVVVALLTAGTVAEGTGGLVTMSVGSVPFPAVWLRGLYAVMERMEVEAAVGAGVL